MRTPEDFTPPTGYIHEDEVEEILYNVQRTKDIKLECAMAAAVAYQGSRRPQDYISASTIADDVEAIAKQLYSWVQED